MSTQIRDTQFGYLVRAISKNRRYRYPDELETFFWKTQLQQQVKPLPSARPGPRSQDWDESKAEDNATDTPTYGIASQVFEADNDAGPDNEVYLVDWYGPDDPEVRCNTFRREAFSNIILESSKLVQ